MEKLLCHKCGKAGELLAADLLRLTAADCFGEANSNDRRLSEDTEMYLECFLADCEGIPHVNYVYK